MTWTLLINGTDYSTSYLKAEFIGELNKPSTFEIELFDTDSSDSNVQAGNIVKLQLNSNTVFKGKITRVEYKDNGTAKIYGYDMSVLLLERTHNQRWSSTNTSNIVSTVCSGVINVGTNTNYGTVDFAIENEPKLLGLAKLARQINYDWWVSWDASDNDYFNIDTQKGSTTSQATFYTSGSNVNCLSVHKEEDREAVINKVKVLGYGDGTQQIDSGWIQHSASQSYYGVKEAIFLDRTIKDVTSAQRLANTILNLYKAHDGTNPQPFYRISLKPIESDYTFTTGDVVTVNDTRTGLSSNDYRVIKKTLILYGNKSPELKIEIANRKRTFLDKILRDSEMTHTISSYQQINDPGHTHDSDYTTEAHSHGPGTYSTPEHYHSSDNMVAADHRHSKGTLDTAHQGTSGTGYFFPSSASAYISDLVGDNTWRNAGVSINVGSYTYMFHRAQGHIYLYLNVTGTAPVVWSTEIHIRIKNTTDNEYYPHSSGIMISDTFIFSPGYHTICIPFNIHIPRQWSNKNYTIQYKISDQDYWYDNAEMYYTYAGSRGHKHDVTGESAYSGLVNVSGEVDTRTLSVSSGVSSSTEASVTGSSKTSYTGITG